MIVPSTVPQVIPEVSIVAPTKEPELESRPPPAEPVPPIEPKQTEPPSQTVEDSPRPPEVTPRITMTSFSSNPPAKVETPRQVIFRPAYDASK